MQKSAILRKVTELQSKLEHGLHSTKKRDLLTEIDDRIGSLSKPSKMPGYAWSIPAKYCITGGKLAKIAGTSCSLCYAKRGRYVFPNVINAQEKRLRAWEDDVDWPILMAIRIWLLGERWFRWFDSGDLQSRKMLEDINYVAKQTEGHVKHWLPTQERVIVGVFGATAPNLTIRISGSKLDSVRSSKIPNTVSSFVVANFDKLSNEVYKCPSKLQGNKCQDCRACWDASVPIVAYHLH